MCKLNCNSMNKTFFEKVDLSESIDNIIGGFFGDNNRNYGSFSNIKIVECGMENCNHKDIDNKFNFKNICNCCDMKICFECFNDNDNDELDGLICNREVECKDWICFECGVYCECCSEYVFNESMRGLKDKVGDYEYFCNWCLNKNHIDFFYNDESYDIESCKVKENEIKGEVNCCECDTEYDFEDEDLYWVNDGEIVCGDCCEFELHYM